MNVDRRSGIVPHPINQSSFSRHWCVFKRLYSLHW